MADKKTVGIAGAIQRQWGIVALVVVVAVGGTAALTWRHATASYVGRAVMSIDYPSVSKFNTLLAGDRMLEILQSNAFFDATSKRTGIPVAELKRRLRTSATGKTLDQVVVTYRAPSEAEAIAGASSAVKALVAFAHDVNAIEYARQQQIIDLRDAAIADLNALQVKIEAGGDPAKEAELIANKATLELEGAAEKSTLESIKDAYTIGGETSASGENATSARLQVLAAAALAGLVAGIALAALREHLRTRGLAA